MGCKVLCSIAMCCTLLNTNVRAEEKNELTPKEVDEILKDVTPVEISQGVYLRDNGSVSMIDIDISQFGNDTSTETLETEDGEMMEEIISDVAPYTWDLSASPYIGSFQAKYRVRSKAFTGYDTVYAYFYDIDCPSDSNWKASLYLSAGWNELACSDWFSGSTTKGLFKLYNLDTSEKYNVAFEKTDDGQMATGNVKIYLEDQEE